MSLLADDEAPEEAIFTFTRIRVVTERVYVRGTDLEQAMDRVQADDVDYIEPEVTTPWAVRVTGVARQQ